MRSRFTDLGVARVSSLISVVSDPAPGEYVFDAETGNVTFNPLDKGLYEISYVEDGEVKSRIVDRRRGG